MKSFVEWLRKKNKSVWEEYLEAAVVILPIVFILRTFLFGLYVVPTGSMESSQAPAGMFVGERFLADKLTIWFKPPQRGEIVALNDPTYEYSHNPVVNMWQRYVWGPSSWTKRVIGVPGDHIQGRIEDGKPVVYVNGKKLDEPYVNQFPLIYMWAHKAPEFDELTGSWRSADGFRIVLRTFDPHKAYDQQLFYKVNPKCVIHGSERPLSDAVYNSQEDYWLRMAYTPDAQGRDVFDVHLGADEYWLMGDNRQNSQDSREFGKVPGKLFHGRIVLRFLSVQYGNPWSFFIFDESWILVDMLLHPIEFWSRVRWSRSFGFVQ